MSTNANQDLSLAKLKRAVSSSIDDYTTESSMLAIAGGGSDVKFSDFSISSVDGLTGFTYLWEQTSEDYLCSFSGRTSERFDIKIAKVPGNFTWGINASGATITNNGATGSVAAAAISNANTGTGDDSDFFPAGTNNLNRTLSVTFKEDGQSDGFNDHATRYNTAVTKNITVLDTYGGQSVACFLVGTEVSKSA